MHHPKVLYLSVDSIQEGVGYSQVFTYLRQLSTHFEITLVSFEKVRPSASFERELQGLNIHWLHYPFKPTTALTILERAWILFKNLKGAELVHARGNFCGFVASLSGAKKIIWDCRALVGIQRGSIKKSSSKNFIEKLFWNFTESRCAKKASRIITITEKTIPYLAKKHKVSINKFEHIGTNVDLSRFKQSPYPDARNRLRFLLLGEMTTYYDLEYFESVVSALKKKVNVEVDWLTPIPNDALARKYGFNIIQNANNAMIEKTIHKAHFGVSILKKDLGISRLSISPTKNAEFLASGRPLLLDTAQGDLGEDVMRCNIGVSTSEQKAISEVVDEILNLSHDKNVASRCYEFARDHYDLRLAVERLRRVYAES